MTSVRARDGIGVFDLKFHVHFISFCDCRVFNLGFGPLPYYRRPGVLVHISPLHRDHADKRKFQLGVVVAHRPGVHGCKYGVSAASGNDNEDIQLEDLHQDERCYFCQDNPFYEVLFTGQEGSPSLTCRIQPERVQDRVLRVGTQLLLKASALERMLPGFRFMVFYLFVDGC